MINLKETRRIKELLLQQPAQYAAIIEDTPLAICITDSQGHFVAVNDNYVTMYGYPRADLIGKHFSMVVPAENREAMKKYHDKFFVEKYEIIRQWKVMGNNGKEMFISADAGYNDRINGKPHKVTLVQMMEAGEPVDKTKLANTQVK